MDKLLQGHLADITMVFVSIIRDSRYSPEPKFKAME
jgi:hypothetical protein